MIKDALKDALKYSTVGVEFAISILVGVFIGYLIDKKIGYTKPWATLLFSVFGFFAGLKRLMVIEKNIRKTKDDNKRS
ncbi:MAG: AtpZ/AtpI family protein [Minisyncoccia bacterium]